MLGTLVPTQCASGFMGAVSGEDVRVRTLRAQDRGMSNSPAERPATLIFDGDCGFCTTAVLWLQRTLPRVPATAPFAGKNTWRLAFGSSDIAPVYDGPQR